MFSPEPSGRWSSPEQHVGPAEPRRPLTPRQEEVAALICRGLGYREIAGEMRISFRTVCSHVNAIMFQLPNPESLNPYLCILLWRRWRTWSQSGVVRLP